MLVFKNICTIIVNLFTKHDMLKKENKFWSCYFYNIFYHMQRSYTE